MKQLVPVKDTPAEYCRYALFGLRQFNESDRWGSWIENNFIYLGEPQFRTEEEALGYLNGDVKNIAKDHYCRSAQRGNFISMIRKEISTRGFEEPRKINIILK